MGYLLCILYTVDAVLHEGSLIQMFLTTCKEMWRHNNLLQLLDKYWLVYNFILLFWSKHMNENHLLNVVS